jgi:hypothetical protein
VNPIKYTFFLNVDRKAECKLRDVTVKTYFTTDAEKRPKKYRREIGRAASWQHSWIRDSNAVYRFHFTVKIGSGEYLTTESPFNVTNSIRVLLH